MKRIVVIASVVLVMSGLPTAPFAAATEACTQRVLVLSAIPAEIDPLLTEATLTDSVVAEGRNFYVGTLKGNEVVLALTGIGLINAEQTTKAAIEHFRCGSSPGISAIVFSGVSGGRTSIGDVAIPRRWAADDTTTWLEVDAGMLALAQDVADDVQLARQVPVGDLACAGVDPDLVTTVQLKHTPTILLGGDGRSSDPFRGRAFPCFPGGGDVFGCEPCRAPTHQVPDVSRSASGIVPFIDPEFFFGYFADPPTTSGADADDMETAAVARVAADAAVPFIAFRALSDGNGDPLMLPGFPFQFFTYRQLAANNAATVALAFLQARAAN